ncbi:hypothetical protein CHELA1G11_13091 [Hyphomicrobiales bacterium]|nr:hypothetical protein CHELA1G2_11218 [Hyphomicrobiales bacterium]CAH1669243.1 hypothetical protein CHELA1G11_13091 [Hyphomicrobiales bacterium]
MARDVFPPPCDNGRHNTRGSRAPSTKAIGMSASLTATHGTSKPHPAGGSSPRSKSGAPDRQDTEGLTAIDPEWQLSAQTSHQPHARSLAQRQDCSQPMNLIRPVKSVDFSHL